MSRAWAFPPSHCRIHNIQVLLAPHHGNAKVPPVHLQDIVVENLCLVGQAIFSVSCPNQAICQYNRAKDVTVTIN
jgi:hypothetical protein